MKPKLNIVLLFFLLPMFPGNLFSQQTPPVDDNEATFNRYVEYIARYRIAPLETILEHTAHFFLGTPYVASTLDQTMDEQLVVNLQELDCVTYVENVLALSLAASSNNFTYHNFKEHLKSIRYRNGELSDYASRLHYTSDWIFDNEQSGLLQNISQELSGLKETKELDFMSTHRSAYKQLAHNDAMLHKIEQAEKTINNRNGFYYLPKGGIHNKANKIPHMAVVAIVTTIDGLDTSHVGFAYQKEGELQFIHASSAKNKVIIDSKTLSNYCFSQKNCKGIIVAKVR